MKKTDQKSSSLNAETESNTTDTQNKKPRLKLKVSTRDTTRDAPGPCTSGPVIN